MSDKYMQIDLINIQDGYAICNLYADSRCVKIIMATADYNYLLRDGFFIRSGKERDSAGVLNTSKEYHIK